MLSGMQMGKEIVASDLFASEIGTYQSREERYSG